MERGTSRARDIRGEEQSDKGKEREGEWGRERGKEGEQVTKGSNRGSGERVRSHQFFFAAAYVPVKFLVPWHLRNHSNYVVVALFTQSSLAAVRHLQSTHGVQVAFAIALLL